MNRRHFIKTSALAFGLFASRGWTSTSPHQNSMMGIQIQPHNMYDEGIEQSLDLLQRTADVNALFLLSHGYYVARGRAPEVLAPDHGWTVRDERKRSMPKVWIQHHESFYKDTTLRHYQNRPNEEYWDSDIFKELQKVRSERGIKLYARLYEPNQLVDDSGKPRGWIKNWESVLTVDLFGNAGSGPCWNNPDYRAWLRATMADMFTHYDLDGLQYGAERVGPLSEVLYRGFVPACFCPYCRERNAEKGIDPVRAKAGYTQLYELIQNAEKKHYPPDGLMTTIMRTLFEYHEIMGWYYQWFAAEREILNMIYDTVKSINKDAEVGWHIDHQRSTWDRFYRAACSYQDMAQKADFIKPILYHEIMGPRMKGWVIAEWKTKLFSELTEEQILQNFYAFNGYDPNLQPEYNELSEQGFSPQYVYREMERVHEAIGEQAKIYAGIGLDIPWNNQPFPSDPDSIYEATMNAYKAGSDGIVISREYDECRVPNLKAVGRAARDWKKMNG